MGPNFLEEYCDCEHGLEAKIFSQLLRLKSQVFFSNLDIRTKTIINAIGQYFSKEMINII